MNENEVAELMQKIFDRLLELGYSEEVAIEWMELQIGAMKRDRYPSTTTQR